MNEAERDEITGSPSKGIRSAPLFGPLNDARRILVDLERVPGIRASTWSAFLMLATLLVGCSGVQQAQNASMSDVSVLVFSKTEGFRHDSIEPGVAAVQEMGAENGFTVSATEDASQFTDDNLGGYDAVVFLNTTGDVLDGTQQAAFERYVRNGGGFVGVHAAADTEYDWEWYGDLVGGYFESHPATQQADVAVLDPAHPATAHLPSRWTRTDEWYNYQANPRGNVHVMATVVERSYEDGQMGDDHPIVWAHLFDGGRSFYTGMGHTAESYADPLYLNHLLGGIRWAAGVVDADVGATLAGAYEEVVLETQITYPMQLEVAGDGRVFWIERDGAVKIYHPDTETSTVAAYMPVTSKIEDGLLGIALDPNFEENNWIYFYYTPISEDPNRISRFTMRGNEVDMSTEVVILEVRMQRERCCHSAGELLFDHEGNLWLSTGDNTGGSAPRTDERPGREHYDAQRTTSNTNDLRGKILRIRPQPDGSYTIPAGNLFEDDDPLTRPEIYTMGHRNPWRFTVDPETGWLYWGDVGPGNQFQEGRMPTGHEEFGQAKEPSFQGWPYFVGPNGAYRDLNFETEEYGDFFDPDRPINDSPNNSGIRELPPAQPAWIYYMHGPSEEFPEMGVGGMSAAAGFVYHYDPERAGPRALPPYFDKKVFLFEWMRNWIHEVLVDENGDPVEITELTPEIAYTRPIDIALGPDQTLYVLEWGNEFWGQNRDGQLVRVDYYGSEKRPPVAIASAEPASGSAPHQVAFSASGSESRNGGSLEYAWDFDGDGTIDARSTDATHVYDAAGAYTARLTVTDSEGMSTEEMIDVAAGNTAPQVSITWPLEGSFVPFNEPIPFQIDVTDAEDGTIASPGASVTLQPLLGHDTHTHPLRAHRGIAGTFNVVPDSSHKPYIINHFVKLVASYTDEGGPGVPQLTSTDEVLLYPNVLQAENTSITQGTELEITANRQRPDFADQTDVYVSMENGGYVAFAPVNLHGVDALTLSVVPEIRGTVEVRLGGVEGDLLAKATLVPPAEEEEVVEERQFGPPTIHWMTYRLPINPPSGEQELFFVFQGEEPGTVAWFDQVEVEGPGVLSAPSSGMSAMR